MKQRVINMVFLVVIMFAVLLGLTGCGDNQAVSDSSEKTPVVLKLEGGDWGFPDPWKHYPRGPGGFKMELIFDSLLEKDEEGLIPWLAGKWEISPDSREYTFTLQDQATWHDGQDLSADDVKFSFDYYRNHPPVWNELTIDGKYIVESVEVIDGQTVKIRVDSANATYLERIGAMRIIPKHIWENVTDPLKFNTQEAAIGCGPYVLEEYNSQLGIYKLKAYEGYWGPKQKVSAMEWVPVSDPVLAFEQGEIDLMIATPDILSRYENNEEFKIMPNQPFFGYRMILNMDKKPELKDANLRKGIAYGIDREEMVEKIARGSGVVNSMGFVPPGHIWFNNQVEQYTFDEEKAKALLGGKTYTFDLLIGVSSQEAKTGGNASRDAKIGELIKISLEKIGITLNVKTVDTKTRDNAVKNGDYELVVTNHGGWGNDADYLRDYYGSATTVDRGSPSSGAIPGYYNQEIYDLCQKQMTELDPEERKATVFRLQELIAADVPQIPLFNTVDNFVFRPAKYDGWMFRYDHNYMEHCKLSYLERAQE